MMQLQKLGALAERSSPSWTTDGSRASATSAQLIDHNSPMIARTLIVRPRRIGGGSWKVPQIAC